MTLSQNVNMMLTSWHKYSFDKKSKNFTDEHNKCWVKICLQKRPKMSILVKKLRMIPYQYLDQG